MPNQPIDPERPRHANPFDQAEGYSGQAYDVAREREVVRAQAEPAFRPAPDPRDLPPDDGRRASIDPRTGEVHGAGAGIGGGNPGEDLGEYSPSGDMCPLTGGEGTDHRPTDLGPEHARE